ncbi:hypothetical protein H9P43_000889 [Blastocladiella emersonii ATCC 22665]|nr:hypothetical protein H9P43_000889 [Blastocladiella emersonii ATCC 22665]
MTAQTAVPSPLYSPTRDSAFTQRVRLAGGVLELGETITIMSAIGAETERLPKDAPWEPIRASLVYLRSTLDSIVDPLGAALKTVSETAGYGPSQLFRCGKDAGGGPLECALYEHHLALLRLEFSLRRITGANQPITAKLFPGSRRNKLATLAHSARATLRDVLSVLSIAMAEAREKSPAQTPAVDLDQLLSAKLAAMHLRGGKRKDDSRASSPDASSARNEHALNDAGRLYALAERYLHGLGVPHCNATAFQLLSDAAQVNPPHAPSWHLLGTLHERGLGTAIDLPAALACYRRAAGETAPKPATPSAEAMTALALMYARGRVVARDTRRAADLFLAASRAGHVPAMTALAALADRSGNTKRADEWYAEAARRGCATARTAMANRARVRGDWEAAAAMWATAARAGSARAMNSLGACYEMGRGVPRDWVLAMTWYRAAAARGDVHALANLGYVWWTMGRYADAWHAWHAAAAQVPASADALFHIGTVYETGLEGPVVPAVLAPPPFPPRLPDSADGDAGDAQDEEPAPWPAVQGDPAPAAGSRGWATSMPATAASALSIPASLSAAVSYYYRAAWMGHVEATRKLVEHLRSGWDGGEPDAQLADEWEARLRSLEELQAQRDAPPP